MAEIPVEVFLFGGAGLVSLVAFATLILAPTLGAYGRGWEKVFASVLSLFVLAALVLLGIAVGALIVYFWDDLSSLIGTGA